MKSEYKTSIYIDFLKILNLNVFLRSYNANINYFRYIFSYFTEIILKTSLSYHFHFLNKTEHFTFMHKKNNCTQITVPFFYISRKNVNIPIF